MKRELTALIAAPLAIWIVGWANPYVFDAAIALIAALALYEFLVLGTRKGYRIPVVLCLAIMLFIVAAFILESVSVEMGVFVALLLIPASYVVSRGDLEDALPSSAIAILATLYVGMLGGAGAYYFGRTFGKHKLSPRISPKKTIEGLIGGVATSIATALVIHFTFFRNFPLIHTIIAGTILSVAGVVGDLAESMWKRSADVKDSGTLIPGHGGFLDRFDSIFYTTPILYAYWFLILHEFKSFKIMSA
jgi:phosphatidate cytidylyltransferase